MGLKLNVGCGTHAVPGWVNIDNSLNARLSKIPGLRRLLRAVGLLSRHHYEIAWPRDIRSIDAAKSLPFPEGAVRYVYASHFLEHLTRARASRFISECYRVLQEQGIIRLVVPDLEAWARQYLLKLDAYRSGADGASTISASEAFLRSCTEARGGNTHRWMYDECSLRQVLTDHGFQRVERRGYCDSRIPEVGALDLPEREQGSLYMEAVR